jgi:hypothetical protein
MKIEHSPLYNDFIDFYFETSVDGKKKYETWFIYTRMRWETEEIDTKNVILSGEIKRAKDQAEEKIEEERIRNVVTAHLLQSQP